MLGAKASGLARWRGILKFARRQLQQRWLESLFILLGIALGVGVFTGMETFVRFTLNLSSESMASVPQLSSVQVMPRRIDLNTFTDRSMPAMRIDPELAEPVAIRLGDLLTLRESIPEIGSLFVSGSGRGYDISAIDGETVDMGFDPERPGPIVTFLVHTTSPDELGASGRTFLAGQSFTWDDVINGRRRIVLEEDAAKDLFPDLTPDQVIGRTVTTSSGPEGIVWTVAGIVARPDRAEFNPWGDSSNFRHLEAYGPLDITSDEQYSQFYVSPIEGVSYEELTRQLQAYMDRLYGPGRIDVQPPMDIGVSYNAILGLLALAGLALFIAAINILNLFTARILRRQRFTGMSIALGATRGMLFWQTAGEAILLGVVGSALGLVFAMGVVRFVEGLLGGGFDQYGGLVLTPIDALVGMLLGTSMSLLFGLYPAWLAARQDPAEALRGE